MPRCCRASAPAGVTLATADPNLFFQPVTTSPSPLIIASNPVLATSAGSSYFDVPMAVSIMPARSKNLVSVAPGIKQVTLTLVSRSSSRSANENESVDRLETSRSKSRNGTGDQDSPGVALPHVVSDLVNERQFR